MKKYIQKNLTEAFRKGNVPGEKVLPIHRKMVISNVFILENRVYKIYKDGNDFYNKNFRDISTKEKRFDFTKMDFDWNRNLTKNIYLELKGCRLNRGSVEFVDFNFADELAIVMKKFEEKSLLSNLLQEKSLTLENFFEIGKQLGQIISGMSKLNSRMNLSEIMELRLVDVKNWLDTVKEYISKETREKIFQVLDNKFADYKKVVKNEKDKGVCPDTHLENLIFENGKISIIDSYPPKEIWKVADFSTNFYRLGADVLMIAGDEAFQKMKEGYLSSGIYFNDECEDFLIFYAALIDWPYLYMLGKKDPNKMKLAEKFSDSIKKRYLI